ncbi:MAG: NAD-dependent epimerase/dehydratase family protein [Polyangiales bacterium]
MTTRPDVLVTGAAGFVGAALVARLGGEGRRVVGVDLREQGGIEHLDVTDARAVDAAIAHHRPKVVVHAAAIVDDRVPRDVTFAVNVSGTENVLAAARRHRVDRLVHVSSIAALGLDPGPDSGPDTPLVFDTGTAYFDTKALSERIVRDAMRREGPELVVVRPGDVYGPGSDPWVNRPLEMMKKRMPVLIGGGRGRMAHAWIDDLVDGLVRCIDHADAPGGVFTFHDGEHSTYRQYLEALADTAGVAMPRLSLPRSVALGAARAGVWAQRFGVTPPMTEGAVRYLTRGATYSTRASEERLGWKPRFSLASAMRVLGERLRS